jgi:PKD repeat protein
MKTSLKVLGLMGAGAALLFAACKPYEADDVSIGNPPTASFSMAFVEGDSNRVVLTDLSQGAFARLWDLGNGKTSKRASDTAYYPTAGTFTIKLYVSAKGGTGTASKEVVIAKSDQNLCNDANIINLTGGCLNLLGKGWTLSSEAASIKVGPAPGSGEWYSSPANGLVVDQADDTFRFFYKDKHFLYENNGKTVFPDQGYQALPYDPPTDAKWELSLGTGRNGMNQILLPIGSFMGVKDASNVYDIALLTESRMELETAFLAGGGYFTLTFVKR